MDHAVGPESPAHEARVPAFAPAAPGPALAVFSHPNHELAVLGLLQRLRPHLLFLSDGGAPERRRQSERGLERLGLLDRAEFMDVGEAALYESLLRRDPAPWERMAERARTLVETHRVELVFCDAVEFYNPLHDMALAVVGCALGRTQRQPAVYELPLVRQVPGEREAYDVGRACDSRSAGRWHLPLEREDAARKLELRDSVYASLREEAQGAIAACGLDEAAREEILTAGDPQRAPHADEVVRYELRGRLRVEAGEVDEAITREGHVLPVVRAMLAG